MAGFICTDIASHKRQLLYGVYTRFLTAMSLSTWDVEVVEQYDGLRETMQVTSTTPDGHRKIETMRSRSMDDVEQNLMWLLLEEYE